MNPTPDDLIRLAKSQDAIAMSATATAERLRELARAIQEASLPFAEFVDPESKEAQSKAS